MVLSTIAWLLASLSSIAVGLYFLVTLSLALFDMVIGWRIIATQKHKFGYSKAIRAIDKKYPSPPIFQHGTIFVIFFLVVVPWLILSSLPTGYYQQTPALPGGILAISILVMLWLAIILGILSFLAGLAFPLKRVKKITQDPLYTWRSIECDLHLHGKIDKIHRKIKKSGKILGWVAFVLTVIALIALPILVISIMSVP